MDKMIRNYRIVDIGIDVNKALTNGGYTKEYITQEDFIEKKKLIKNKRKNYLTEILKIYKDLFIH